MRQSSCKRLHFSSEGSSVRSIGIGLVGTGYMGKAHAVALKSVGAVFNTRLRPVCEMICTTTVEGAARKAAEYGFNGSTSHWQELGANPKVEAVMIASPQTTHREIALAAFAAGKPVFCEKPLGASLDDARAMAAAAARSGLPNMVGFNYIRAPAMQLACQMIQGGEIGDIIHIRAEHTGGFPRRSGRARELADARYLGWKSGRSVASYHQCRAAAGWSHRAAGRRC